MDSTGTSTSWRMDNPLAHQSASHNNATNNSQVNSESSSAKTSAGTEANQHATSEQQQQTGAQVENTDDASAGDGKDKPNVKKSRCYSCLTISFALLQLLVNIVIVFLPAWFEADVPSQGVETYPVKFGFFHLCGENQTLAPPSQGDLYVSSCSLIQWEFESDQDVSSSVKRMYIQYTFVRMIITFTILSNLFLLISLGCCGGARKGLLVHLMIDMLIYATSAVLTVDMRGSPKETLQMLSGLEVLDYVPDRDDGGNVSPSLTVDVSFFLLIVLLVLCIPTGMFIYVSKHKQDKEQQQQQDESRSAV